MPDKGASAVSLSRRAVLAWLVCLALLGPFPAAGAETGGPFALVDPAGRTFTDTSFRGKWELIYFGYTFCPDLCPTTFAVISDALDRLGPLAERLQPIFVTLDPKRDTPAVVGAYVKAIDPRILGLTGSPAAIDAAARQYHVCYQIEKNWRRAG
jgi:protein SCO1/2